MAKTESAGVSRALIFMTARNCEAYVAGSLASLARQTLEDLHVLFIDDCSTDKTAATARKTLDELFAGRHTFIRNRSRKGKARNAWEHLRPFTARAEFVAVLDGDDQLVEASILERMAASYRSGKDAVWTNYVTDRGQAGGCGPLNPDVSPRQQPWRTSHFFSFRASLLDNVPEDYFKDSAGEWLESACDIAIALPVLDQTRRYEFIPVNAYRYTSANPQSHHNLDAHSVGFSSTSQKKNAREVYMKPSLPVARPAVAPRPQAPQVPEGNAVPPRATPPISDPVTVNTWQDLAGAMLMSECPNLMNALAFSGQSHLTPVEIWALRGVLQKRGSGARILHIGMTRSALVLAALASAYDSTITCLCASPVEAEEMRARAATCGLTESISVIETNVIQALFEEFAGPFPDIRAVEEGMKFDVVVIDLPRTLPKDSALVSLSVIGDYLAPEGFAICLMAKDRATESLAEQRWRNVSNGLTFFPDAIGGSGLMVAAGR